MMFQILALSGGGYRGLFTIEVLCRLEQSAGRPIGECFDLIAGTSIGGIIAIGLAMGSTAEKIRKEFLVEGEAIFPRGVSPNDTLRSWASLATMAFKPKYDGTALLETINRVVGSNKLMHDAKTRLLIPSVNMTKGSVQMFKTPHHPKLVMDGNRRAIDVAMATSAAPTFFPLADSANSYYADGGLAANAPDACAIHEAVHFAGQAKENLRIISIGTTSAGFGMPRSSGARFGIVHWSRNQRLLNTIFGVQQQLVEFMVSHELRDRYLRIDVRPSPEQFGDLGLDLAKKKSRETLQGLAEGAYQHVSAHPLVLAALKHHPSPPDFVAARQLSRLGAM
jgi:uncharacterized protein